MDSYVVRRATSSDVPALGRLGALLMRIHNDFDRQRFMNPGDAPEAGYAAFIQSQLDGADSAIFVAERQGSVVGYVYIGIEPQSWKELRDRAGFIHDIVVEAEGRRIGIASALVNAALCWLKDQNAPRVLLWTSVDNDAAQALFARHGFRKTMIEMTRELEASAPVLLKR